MLTRPPPPAVWRGPHRAQGRPGAGGPWDMVLVTSKVRRRTSIFCFPTQKMSNHRTRLFLGDGGRASEEYRRESQPSYFLVHDLPKVCASLRFLSWLGKVREPPPGAAGSRQADSNGRKAQAGAASSGPCQRSQGRPSMWHDRPWSASGSTGITPKYTHYKHEGH